MLETIVFGRITSQSITHDLPHTPAPDTELVKNAIGEEQERIDSLLARDKGENMFSILEDLKKMMFDHFGIFREESKMKEGLQQIRSLKERYSQAYINNKGKIFNQALIRFVELEGMLMLAEVVGKAALERRESRGSHTRTDYPERNDQKYLMHTISYLQNDKVKIDYTPVKMGTFEPQERAY